MGAPLPLADRWEMGSCGEAAGGRTCQDTRWKGREVTSSEGRRIRPRRARGGVSTRGNACSLLPECVRSGDASGVNQNPTTTPTRKIRGLRFCAMALNVGDAMLLLRTSAVFALKTLKQSRMPRRLTCWNLNVRDARRSVFHRLS